jgi:hypothetical protein
MSTVAQHFDFGEKIGGAKKDLWRQRGLLSGDLSSMNEREADKYVTKDNVWKKPDYQALIDSGIPVDIVYFIKTIRDSLETKPLYRRTDDTPAMRTARQMQYIDTVREVKAVTENVTCKADVLAVFDKYMVGNGYYEAMCPGGSVYYSLTAKGRENTAISDKLSRAMCIRSERDYLQKIVYKREKAQFGVSKDDKIPAGYAIRFNDGKNTWSAKKDWKPETFYVTKGHSILQANFTTQDDALKWVREHVKQRRNGKQRFVPPQLEDVQRDGPDYRDGRDVTGQHYLDAFGFRGGEFGNWLNHNDRQASLNFGFDALKDLADALCISDKDISYQGELSIAFGARGSGNAAAHYEALRNVINLTKMHGAGSLGHEWWHGLDDFLGSKLNAGGYLSERYEKHPLMAKLIETIKRKPETSEQAATRAESSDARTRRSAERRLENDVLPYIKRAGDDNALKEYEQLKTAFLNGEKGSVEKLSAFKKRVTGRIIKKDVRSGLETYESALRGMTEDKAPKIGKVETEYYRSSKEMATVCEKDGGYWESNIEMTARAFATYVMDKIPGRSDYLIGHAECAIAPSTDKDGNLTLIRAYPQGEERAAINAVFDELFEDLKAQGLLTHEDRQLSRTSDVGQLSFEYAGLEDIANENQCAS